VHQCSDLARIRPDRDGPIVSGRFGHAPAATLAARARQSALRTRCDQLRKIESAPGADGQVAARCAAQHAVLRQKQVPHPGEPPDHAQAPGARLTARSWFTNIERGGIALILGVAVLFV
jgi:hypothetical protein